jgi:hypothetical protein
MRWFSNRGSGGLVPGDLLEQLGAFSRAENVFRAFSVRKRDCDAVALTRCEEPTIAQSDTAGGACSTASASICGCVPTGRTSNSGHSFPSAATSDLNIRMHR